MEFIDDFLRFLKLEKKYSNLTIKSYSFDLNLFACFLENEFSLTDFIQVNSSHIRFWIISLSERGDEHKTINRRISSLKSFYKFLLRGGFVDNTPLSKIKQLKFQKKVEPIYSLDEMKNLLDEFQFSDGFTGLKDNLMLNFLYFTGVRLNELINIRLSDVDLMKNELKILGKGNKQRIVPILQRLKPLVLEYLSERQKNEVVESDFLFFTEKGKKMYPKYVYNKVNKYLSLVTSKRKKSPHMFRHTFATHIIDQGGDLNAVKELMGHSSIASTQVYVNSDIKKIKNKYNQAHPRAKNKK